MEPKSLLTHNISNDSGDNLWFYGGTIPVSQTCHNSSRKKSKVRLNDQLIPKPTDINLAEKMIQVSTPKEHPYSSHVSRFAIFPSFRSPDDPESGVRASSRRFLGLVTPNAAPDVNLMSKTKGAPFRHEIIETPEKTQKKAVKWTGEHGFYDKTKPVKGEKQVFYPTPPKTILPNPRLRHWDISLSDRTSNMLRNLERALWVTSYQMHYTGLGPANPLKMDDFKDKMIAGVHSHDAPLRERSHPEFVPSKAKRGCKRRSCSPSAAQLLKSDSTEAIVQKQTCSKVRFDESLMRRSSSQSSQEATSRPHSRPEEMEAQEAASSEGEDRRRRVESELSSVLPSIRPLIRYGNAGRGDRSLLELQDSFSKTEAHRSFNRSVTRAAVDLRDNEEGGRKHDFYGINCSFIHG